MGIWDFFAGLPESSDLSSQGPNFSAFQANGNAPPAPITEQRWWHDASSRHLGFVANTGGKLPKIYFFRDFRNLEAEVENEVPTAE